MLPEKQNLLGFVGIGELLGSEAIFDENGICLFSCVVKSENATFYKISKDIIFEHLSRKVINGVLTNLCNLLQYRSNYIEYKSSITIREKALKTEEDLPIVQMTHLKKVQRELSNRSKEGEIPKPNNPSLVAEDFDRFMPLQITKFENKLKNNKELRLKFQQQKKNAALSRVLNFQSRGIKNPNGRNRNNYLSEDFISMRANAQANILHFDKNTLINTIKKVKKGRFQKNKNGKNGNTSTSSRDEDGDREGNKKTVQRGITPFKAHLNFHSSVGNSPLAPKKQQNKNKNEQNSALINAQIYLEENPVQNQNQNFQFVKKHAKKKSLLASFPSIANNSNLDVNVKVNRDLENFLSSRNRNLPICSPRKTVNSSRKFSQNKDPEIQSFIKSQANFLTIPMDTKERKQRWSEKQPAIKKKINLFKMDRNGSGGYFKSVLMKVQYEEKNQEKRKSTFYKSVQLQSGGKTSKVNVNENNDVSSSRQKINKKFVLGRQSSKSFNEISKITENQKSHKTRGNVFKIERSAFNV